MRSYGFYLMLLIIFISCKNPNERTKTENKPSDSASLVASVITTNNAPADSATMQKNMLAYMTTGKEHQMMDSWKGNWTGEVTMWMKPGDTPLHSMVTASNKMIMGGRYLLSDEKGFFNNMPFEGRSTLGFDNSKKLFISTWIDNMGTGTILLQGTWNETTKSITLTGTETDPGTGMEKNLRQVIRIIDNDRQVFDIYEEAAGRKEFKAMQIIFSRKR